MTIAALFALRVVLDDFVKKVISKDGEDVMDLEIDAQTWYQLQEEWTQSTSFIKDSKRLHEGVMNALEDADRVLMSRAGSDTDDQATLRDVQTKMNQWITSYIENKIVFAQEEMLRLGIQLFSKTHPDTIMVMGQGLVLERLFISAKNDHGLDFTVIVVDTCPSFNGRALARRLSVKGVKVVYTLIQGASALINTATKLFIGASYVLGNGGVVSTVGTSMVAYLASQHKVPVIAFCETYKFTQRVNLDQIKNNELGDPRELTHNCLKIDQGTEESDALLNNQNLRVQNLKYDFTDMSCVTMILCEIGRVSPVSVAVVVDEFNAEREELNKK